MSVRELLGVGLLVIGRAIPLACALGIATAAAAQGTAVVPHRLESAQLRRMIDSVRKSYNLPALGVAVFSKDSIFGLDVVGVRRKGDATAATTNDLFHIGSDAKAMTAGLLGLLVDRGKLRWDSRLAEIFPELASSMRPEYRDLTVREVLTHRAGLWRDPYVSFIDSAPQRTPRQQREAFVRWIVKEPLDVPRGQFQYSNSGYILAGAIAERLLDGEFERVLITDLLRPLGITSAGFGAPGRADILDQPRGHRVAMLGIRQAITPGAGADNSPVYSPAGRLHLSLPDWVRWCQAVMRAARSERSPWSIATGRSLVTPLAGDTSASAYAFGWGVAKRTWAGPTGRTLSHAGSNGRWYAIAWLAPDTDFGILVVTNQGGDKAARATDAAAAAIIRMSRPIRGSVTFTYNGAGGGTFSASETRLP